MKSKRSARNPDLAYTLVSDLPAFLENLFIAMGWNVKAPLSEIEFDMAAFAAGLVYHPETHTCTPDPDLCKYRGILGPRWSGKTHIVSCATLNIWRLLRDVDRKVFVVSAAENNAKDTLRLIRSCLDYVPWLGHLKPRQGQIDNDESFDVGPCIPARQPSVSCLGLEGQLEGKHAHGVIGDDIETDQNTQTIKLRQKLDERVSEFKSIAYGELPEGQVDPLDAPIDPPEVVYVGTYHNEDSLYPKLAKRGYRFRTYPLVYPEPGDKHLGLAPIIARNAARNLPNTRPGLTCFPHRFDAKYVSEKRLEGPRHFNLQFKLVCDNSAFDKNPLKLRDLIVTHVHRDFAPVQVAYGTSNSRGSTALNIPVDGLADDTLYGPAFVSERTAPYTHTVAYVDPAGLGSDKTGISVVGHLAGMFWIKCCKGIPGGYDLNSVNSIALTLREHGANECFLETNIDYGGGFLNLLQEAIARHAVNPGHPAYPNGWNCSLSKARALGQKEVRIINTLEKPFASHRTVIDQAAIELSEEEPNNELQRQITRITRERGSLPKDDKIDSLAGAIKELLAYLAINPDTAAEDTIAEIIDREMNEDNPYFKPTIPSWLQSSAR